MLENGGYTGQYGWPAILEREQFEAAQTIRKEKTAKWTKHPADTLKTIWKLVYCGECGDRMQRIGGKKAQDAVLFKCVNCECGNRAEVLTTKLQKVVEETKQAEKQKPYKPSAETIRLDNAINRGIEKTDDPAEVRRLILQGAEARYRCLARRTMIQIYIYINKDGTIMARTDEQEE